MTRPFVSLVIPVFNEAETLNATITRVREALRRVNWEIIFVNDGSLDKSEEILDRLATLHSEVKVVHLRRNFGQTAAMMAGFDFASGDVIIPMDGDGQNDPEDIPRMLAKESPFHVPSSTRRDGQRNRTKS